MKLAADVFDRPMPYQGSNHVARALANDPALRSLPSDVLARRMGVSRTDAERAIAHLVRSYAGALPMVAGRSFDESIADAGMARRASLTPEPSREAAGFNAGQSMADHMRGRASYVRRFAPPGRASFDRGAMGYQTPPIPDLSMILLSDAFPVTRRNWSQGPEPTDEEVQCLNWQNPLVTGATSAQSLATLKAISAGCYSWSQGANVGGNQIAARSAQGQAICWQEMQQIMIDVANGNVIYAPTGKRMQDMNIPIPNVGRWGLMPPNISKDYTELQYWYLADGAHPFLKGVVWSNSALRTLAPGESVLDATWAKEGGHYFIWVNGGTTMYQPGEGWDAERESMKMFAGLAGTIQTLTTAIATAVSVYCPACAVAIKVGGQMASNAAKGAVTTKALAGYGDLMLNDAQQQAMRGDATRLNSLRGFAGALIGLPIGAQAGSQPNGGLVWDYLASLGTAWGNVPSALYTFALDHSNKIGGAGDLAVAAQVPLEDAQYAVAAMTDTLTRFSANLKGTYFEPQMSMADRMKYTGRYWNVDAFRALSSGPFVKPGSAGGRAQQGVPPVVLGAAAVGAAWYLGLLKGLL